MAAFGPRRRVVLAAILVPQGMAYAELAGLPTVTGLYTTIACLIGYALFGPSRVLVLGPDSSISPLIFAAITPHLVAGDSPETAIALAGMLALLVGGVLLVLLVLPRITIRVPAILVAVVGATALSAAGPAAAGPSSHRGDRI